MIQAEELCREVERMKAEGKTLEEIMGFCDEMIWKWNKETLAEMRLQKLMDGVTA